MKEVTVEKDELIARLKTNREEHLALFTKAQEGYRQDVIEELDKSLKDARAGRALRVMIHLQAPQNHTEEYDNVLAMLAMSVDNEITLDAHSFQCYVRNQWPWFAASTTINTMYASKVK